MVLVDKGTELIVVRDLLGHASVQTTKSMQSSPTIEKEKPSKA